MKIVLKIGWRVDGFVDPKIFDKYIQYYDPTLDKDEVFILNVTDNPLMAKHFATVQEATDYWRQICPNKPVREDGQPNRPLSAYCIGYVNLDHPHKQCFVPS